MGSWLNISNNNLNIRTIKILNIVSLTLFFTILLAVLSNSKVLEIDAWVSTHVPIFQTPFLTDIVIFITNLNSVVGSIMFSVFFVMFLLYKKYYIDLKFYLLTFFGASALFPIIKLLVERTRPILKIVNEEGLSFPSGHSTMSMVIALSLYFIFIKKMKTDLGRKLLFIACITWPIIIAATRLYLNVHWLSDTLAGISIGVFWVTLVVVYFLNKTQKKNSPEVSFRD